MSDNTVCGFQNYPTFAVAVWIENDSMLNADCHALVKRYSDPLVLAGVLHDWVESMAPKLGSTVWADMLTWGLADVCWTELAIHFQTK